MMNVLLILLAAPTCLLAQSGSITTTTTTTTAPRTLQPVIPCGGYLTEPNGTITSPGYPKRYPHSAECIWVISAPSPAHIVLDFNDLDLEGNSNFVCDFDYLEVRDGNTPTSSFLGNFCGHEIPSRPLVTSGPAMWIKFYSDGSINGGGFSISYHVDANGTRQPTTLAPCGGNRTSLTGEILSPGYPRQYRRLEDCVWTVEVPLNHQITLIFNHFQLKENNCINDYLGIWNGLSEDRSPLVGKFCADHPHPANITLDTNQARLRFVSVDITSSSNGFNITYDARQMGCGRRENSTKGKFAAPGYPEDIAMESNLSCVWQFQTNPGNQLKLSFSYINSTYMKVRTGNSQGQLVDLPDYTARGGLYTVPIHNNSVWVEYAPGDHPNALPNTRSHTFKASYETVCGATINDTHGVIESPGFPRGYQKNMNCSWILEAPAGLRYFILLETVDLEWNCRYDNVTVFDGADPETRQQVAFKCHGNPQNVSLSSRTGLIQFKTDAWDMGRGFRIIYQAAAQVCGATINNMHGVIESPGFPRGYGTHMNCSWTLEAPAGLRYFLYLETVDLEPYDDNCRFDNVTVFDGADPETRQQVAVVCQSRHQQNVSLSSRTGLIQFKTDLWDMGRGFRIIYQAVAQSTTTTTTPTATSTTTTTATKTTTTMTTTTSTPTTTTTTPAPTTTTPTTTTTSAPTTTTTTPAPTTTPTTTTAASPITTTTPTTITSTETTTNKAKTNVGGNTSSHRDSSAIAGGVIGGIIIIIIIVVVVALLRWRRRMDSDLPFTKFTNGDEGVTISGPKKGYKK